LYHEFRTRQSLGDLRFQAGHFGMLKKVSEPFVRQPEGPPLMIREQTHIHISF